MADVEAAIGPFDVDFAEAAKWVEKIVQSNEHFAASAAVVGFGMLGLLWTSHH